MKKKPTVKQDLAIAIKNFKQIENSCSQNKKKQTPKKM